MVKSKKINTVEKKSATIKTTTTPPVVHNIQEFNIGDNIVFMCLGSEINGVVIKVDKGNKLLVVNGENNIIYHVHLSKANSQFFYVI